MGVLPKNWRKIWFFHVARKDDIASIAEKGLEPRYLIDTEHGGHFGSVSAGEEFVRLHGGEVLFFARTPEGALDYADEGDVLLRFHLPASAETKSVREDATGYFGALVVKPDRIEASHNGNWLPLKDFVSRRRG